MDKRRFDATYPSKGGLNRAADNVCKCLTMACEVQGVSLGFGHLKKCAQADARRRLTCKTQDPANAKTRQRQMQMQREDRVAEDRNSEFRIQRRQSPKDDSDGSKQYANNTKTAVGETVRRVAVDAIRRATTGRAEEPNTAADHAGGAGVGANWIDTT